MGTPYVTADGQVAVADLPPRVWWVTADNTWAVVDQPGEIVNTPPPCLNIRTSSQQRIALAKQGVKQAQKWKVFVCRVVMATSTDEIAGRMQMSSATVRKSVTAAADKLRARRVPRSP